MTMEEHAAKFSFQIIKKKSAEDNLVPLLWGKPIIDSFFSYYCIFVHAAALGGTCVFTFALEIVNKLIKNSSRDDRPSIST